MIFSARALPGRLATLEKLFWFFTKIIRKKCFCGNFRNSQKVCITFTGYSLNHKSPIDFHVTSQSFQTQGHCSVRSVVGRGRGDRWFTGRPRAALGRRPEAGWTDHRERPVSPQAESSREHYRPPVNQSLMCNHFFPAKSTE